MFYTIYKTINLINGKIYIGMHETMDPNDSYIGSGNNIKKAIKKYGKENFTKEILHIFDNKQQMIAKEIEIVTLEFCLQKTNYNTCPGGRGGALRQGSVLSTETKEKIKNSLKRYRENNPDYVLALKRSRPQKTEEQIRNHKEAFQNRIWVTNPEGTISKMIYKKDLSLYPEWMLGRNAWSPKTKGTCKKKLHKRLTKEERSEINRRAQTGLKRSLESIKKTVKHNSKKYQITIPSGETFEIENLKEFCRNNGLTAPLMLAVAKGIQIHHKRYKCQQILS